MRQDWLSSSNSSTTQSSVGGRTRHMCHSLNPLHQCLQSLGQPLYLLPNPRPRTLSPQMPPRLHNAFELLIWPERPSFKIPLYNLRHWRCQYRQAPKGWPRHCVPFRFRAKLHWISSNDTSVELAKPDTSKPYIEIIRSQKRILISIGGICQCPSWLTAFRRLSSPRFSKLKHTSSFTNYKYNVYILRQITEAHSGVNLYFPHPHLPWSILKGSD